MRIVIVASLALLFTACGAYAFPASPTPSPQMGTVSGRVVAVPCTPVERVGDTCAGRPVGGLKIDYRAVRGNETTTTDSSGNYSIQLPPGTWKVELATYMRLISGPTTIAIAAGSALQADYLLDSGIRAPAPQA